MFWQTFAILQIQILVFYRLLKYFAFNLIGGHKAAVLLLCFYFYYDLISHGCQPAPAQFDEMRKQLYFNEDGDW